MGLCRSNRKLEHTVCCLLRLSEWAGLSGFWRGADGIISCYPQPSFHSKSGVIFGGPARSAPFVALLSRLHRPAIFPLFWSCLHRQREATRNSELREWKRVHKNSGRKKWMPVTRIRGWGKCGQTTVNRSEVNL